VRNKNAGTIGETVLRYDRITGRYMDLEERPASAQSQTAYAPPQVPSAPPTPLDHKLHAGKNPAAMAAVPIAASTGGSNASRTNTTNGRGNDNGTRGHVAGNAPGGSTWGRRNLNGLNKRPPSPRAHGGDGRGAAGGAADGQYVRQGLPGVPMSNGFPTPGDTPPVPFSAPPTPGDATGRSPSDN
jgi:hypothetical protein